MVGESISHYRVLAQIGAGGMGVVYRAYDEQLEREVALKVLPPGMLAEEGARKRFRKEALALARLNHPNIATIFEFGSDGDRDFLVTEYIPGITLDAKLSAGPLESAELMGLGTQLANGLAAAHAQGLIHRDLKPGNLRLTPDGRLKILDFGLAQLAPRPSELGNTVTLTRTQEVAGTLPYMAPEQLRGAVSDARTDIWAAGAVLHEMATGRRPFPDPSVPALINAILNSAPAAPSKSNPKIPAGIDRIVLKALQKDASRRYQSAVELRTDLERLAEGKPVAQPRPPGKSTAIAFVIFLLALVVGVFFWVRKGRQLGNLSAPRRSVAVLGFKNLAGNKEQSWLSTALSEMLTTELAAGDKIRIVPGENVARAEADLQLADVSNLGAQSLLRVNHILGVNLVVLGSYLDLDGQIRVDVRVEDASGGDTVASFSDTGTETQLFDLVRRVGEALRDKCGAGAVTSQQATAIRASQPGNADAAKLYSQGLTDLRSYNTMAARDLLSQAVAKDPSYALAHQALAAAWSQLGYDEQAKKEAKLAFDLSSGLSHPEAVAIEARYREESREWNKAVQIYRSLWTVFGDDPEYGLRLASAQVSAGQGQDALSTVDKLRSLPAPLRDDPRIDLAEAAAARSLSGYQRDAAAAAAAVRKAQQRGSEGLQAEGLLQQCWALRNLGDPERAKIAGQQAGEILAKVGDMRGQARSVTCVGDVLADQGQLAAAAQMHQQALQLARKVGAQKDIAGALINLGNVLASQQKIAESTNQYKSALALAISIGDQADALLAQDNLGANLSVQGDYAGAIKLFADSVRTAQQIGDQAGIVNALINRAAVSYLQADLETAQADLQQAVDKARQLQLKNHLAVALGGIGDVLLAKDDLHGAQTAYQQSLQLRQELGETGGIANSQVSLAQVAVESGQSAQAESLARDAAKEFESENDADQRTAAEDVLLQALMAQSRLDQAAQEFGVAQKLGARDLPTTLSLAITGAQLIARRGKTVQAEHDLREAERRAAEKGLQPLAWRARLVLAETQIGSGNIASARANLGDIKRQARPRGFQLLARKAGDLENSLQKRD